MAHVGDQQVNFRNWLAELDDDSRARFERFLEIAAAALSRRTPQEQERLANSGYP